MANDENDTIWIGPPFSTAQFAFGMTTVVYFWASLLMFFTYTLANRKRANVFLLAVILVQSLHKILLTTLIGMIATGSLSGVESNPLLGGDSEKYRRITIAMFFFGFLADISLLAIILRTLHSRYDALYAKFAATGPINQFLFLRKSAGWVLLGLTSTFGLIAQALAADDAWFNVASTTDARFPRNGPDLAIRSTWTAFRTLLFIDILLLAFALYVNGRRAGFRDRVVSNFVRIAIPCIAIQAIWGIVYRVVTSVATFPNEESAYALNLMALLANDIPSAIIILALVLIAWHPQWATLVYIYYHPKPTYPSA